VGVVSGVGVPKMVCIVGAPSVSEEEGKVFWKFVAVTGGIAEIDGEVAEIDGLVAVAQFKLDCIGRGLKSSQSSAVAGMEGLPVVDVPKGSQLAVSAPEEGGTGV